MCLCVRAAEVKRQEEEERVQRAKVEEEKAKREKEELERIRKEKEEQERRERERESEERKASIEQDKLWAEGEEHLERVCFYMAYHIYLISC